MSCICYFELLSTLSTPFKKAQAAESSTEIPIISLGAWYREPYWLVELRKFFGRDPYAPVGMVQNSLYLESQI